MREIKFRARAKTKQKIMDYAVKLLEDKKWKKIKFM